MAVSPQPPPSPSPAPPRTLDLSDLEALSVLGRGAKGVVFFVRRAEPPGAAGGRGASGVGLALKAISRTSVELKGAANNGGDAYRRIWFEHDTLLGLRHPLLPALHGVVSTEKIVGFVIDRCSGGDLNSLRRRQTEKMFSDDVIRFYAAELVLALEYLHSLGIVYRDLKPENVLIQDSGHIMLVDFDLSTRLASSESPKSDRNQADASPPLTPAATKKNGRKKARKGRKRIAACFSCQAGITPGIAHRPEETAPRTSAGGESPPSSVQSSENKKSNSFVGTEEYVSPEIIDGSGHDFAVDWWGLGVVLYEMLYGRTPFRGQNRKETFYRILTKAPELTGEQTPLRDLIRKLLEKDPNKRIACEEIKRHEFFRGVNWDDVLDISRPPFIPTSGAEWEEEIAGEDGGSGAAAAAVVVGIDVEKTVEEVLLAREKEKKAAEDAKRAKEAEEEGQNGPSTNAKNAKFDAF